MNDEYCPTVSVDTAVECACVCVEHLLASVRAQVKKL